MEGAADGLRAVDEHFARGRWRAVVEELGRADAVGPIGGRSLEQLAIARLLIGEQEAGEDTLARAHEAFLHAGDVRRATRCAFWLGLVLVLRGEMARGGGWIGRSHEVLGQDEECAERGLLMTSAGLQAMGEGRAGAAQAVFEEAGVIGRRTDDDDVVALARLGAGQALLRQGRQDEGLATLDQAMTAVEAGVLSPLLTGIIYCAVIEECQRVFDVARAREWTSALSRWCESQPDLVAYRGQCLVYRAEIVQRHGDWDEAFTEARRARDQLARPPGHPATGLALYRLGELHRLRGEFEEAHAAYRKAHEWGHSVLPGLPLLRLAEGDAASAAATIRRVLDDTSADAERCQILPAAVRILCASADVDGGREAAAELVDLAETLGAPYLRAQACYCTGLVQVARRDARAAVGPLGSALDAWRDFQAPYEEALTRIEIGQAYRALGDADSASLELDTARVLLVELGAVPELARLDSMRVVASFDAHGLTLRELQVLRSLATGSTNREIGEELYISTRTVDRHVSNLYTKLGVSSRAAATSYAHEHALI